MNLCSATTNSVAGTTAPPLYGKHFPRHYCSAWTRSLQATKPKLYGLVVPYFPSRLKSEIVCISFWHHLRDPHFISVGDASGDAGGTYSEFLMFWFDIMWSDRGRKSMTLLPSNPDYVHINSLVFIVVILQLAAVIVRLETLSQAQTAALFLSGIPAQPIPLSFTDNTTAIKWSNKVTSKSLQSQQLIGIVAELLRTRIVGLNSTHIPGVDSALADYISRPTKLNLSHSDRSEQILQMHASAWTWDYFLPSQELSQCINCALCSKSPQGLPSLPKALGRFVPAGSTISCGSTL
jgi:hypothetical protein